MIWKNKKIVLRNASYGQRFKPAKLGTLSLAFVEETEKDEVKEDALDTSNNATEETSLLASLQILLRINGLERSVSSIRDMADVTDGEFGYSDAVSALENLEFSANVGQLRLRKLTQGHCPAIVELKGGKTAVLTQVDPKKEYVLYDESADGKFTKYTEKDFRKIYNGGLLLVRNSLKKGNKTK